MRILFAIMSVFLFAIAISAQKTSQPDFESMEKGAWNAFGKGDGAYFQAFLAEDAVVFNGVAPTSKAQLVKDVSAKPCEVKSFTFSNFKTTMINPDTALVTYFADQVTSCAGQPQPAKVLSSSIYVKRNGKWTAFYHQESPVMGM
jgi:hypothetical protein